MRTLLIILLMFCTYSSYSVMPKCDSVKVKSKAKQTERIKKPKKTGGEEPDVRMQPNFMNLIY